MKRIVLLITMIGWTVLLGCASMISPWAMNQASDIRFIPVEMWTGAEWSGDKQVSMQPTQSSFGSRDHKSIAGPKPWTHPVTGESLQVYERLNETKRGVKRQLFTISADQRGLAKVYDERPGQPTRLFSTQAILFPLGKWRKGEKKTFRFDEYVNGKPVRREATIHIRRLSFTYKNAKYALKYDYLMHDDKGEVVFHERFIYGPGQSLMYFKDRL